MIGYDKVKLRLGGISHLLQVWLFPQLKEDIGELDEKDRLVVEVQDMFHVRGRPAGVKNLAVARPRRSSAQISPFFRPAMAAHHEAAYENGGAAAPPPPAFITAVFDWLKVID